MKKVGAGAKASTPQGFVPSTGTGVHDVTYDFNMHMHIAHVCACGQTDATTATLKSTI